MVKIAVIGAGSSGLLLAHYLLRRDRQYEIDIIVRQRLAKLLHRLFPKRFLPPLFEALHESSIPYADILREYQSWCNKVKKSRQKFSKSSY